MSNNKLGINKLKSVFPPVHSIILGILASVICGFMLAKTFFYENRILILVFYTILFGFLLGASISYGAKRNKYKKKLNIFILITLCSFLTYLIFSFSFIVIFTLSRNYKFWDYLSPKEIILKWPLQYQTALKIFNKEDEPTTTPTVVIKPTPAPSATFPPATPTVVIELTSAPSATFPPVISINYRKISSQILQKKVEWVKKLGPEPGTKKTVDWLNNKLPEEPLPDSIAEAIEKAAFSPPDSMEYTYKDGLSYIIFGESFLYGENYEKKCLVSKINIIILLLMCSITIFGAYIYIIITCLSGTPSRNSVCGNDI
jgi:hypothetical protein